MQIINYLQCYEEKVVELWNKCCSFDSLTVDKFRKQALFDDNFDSELSWVAIEGDEVIGYVLATKRKFPYLERGVEPDKGWINVIFVDPDYRRKSIGKTLLHCAEEKLISMGCKHIFVGAYSPNYFFAGVDPVHHHEAISFFEKEGYLLGAEHFSMAKDLHGFVLSDSIIQKKKIAEAKGFEFKTFDYAYSIELLNFLKEEFGGGWKRNALIAMQNQQAEDLIQIVLNPEKKICGFCMRMIDGNPMRFGPIGIAKANRNDGLGSILLNVQCYEMCKKGIYHMYFITTDMDGRRYYERQGLQVFRSFVEVRKDI